MELERVEGVSGVCRRPPPPVPKCCGPTKPGLKRTKHAGSPWDMGRNKGALPARAVSATSARRETTPLPIGGGTGPVSRVSAIERDPRRASHRRRRRRHKTPQGLSTRPSQPVHWHARCAACRGRAGRRGGAPWGGAEGLGPFPYSTFSRLQKPDLCPGQPPAGHQGRRKGRASPSANSERESGLTGAVHQAKLFACRPGVGSAKSAAKNP